MPFFFFKNQDLIKGGRNATTTKRNATTTKRNATTTGGEAYSTGNFVVFKRKNSLEVNYSFLQTACAFPLALRSMRPLAIISSRSSSRIAAISASLNFRIGLVCCARSLSQFNAYRWVESALVVISRCRDLAKSCPCPI